MKKKGIIAGAVLLGLIILCLAAFLRLGKRFLYETHYESAGAAYKEEVFGNRKVLFFVPHEDDDSNLAQGVIEQYADAGSEVYVVFMTNGDLAASAETRISEALQAEEANGVSEDHVIFLGYGNMWDEEINAYDHIYDAPDDYLMTSMVGLTETYGTETVSDYRTQRSGSPAPYTRGALFQDIEDVITDIMPDTIYCIDLDEHPDHRAASLAFETVLGRMLSREGNAYFPIILKGFGYCTAWDGEKAYYGDIVPSTKNPALRAYIYNDNDDDDDYLPHTRAYNWSDRVRIPVAERVLAYTRRSSSAYRTLSAFESQIFALPNLEKIVKADKVYWHRRTDSLLYSADIAVSSGDGSVLNDFKLYDTTHVTNDDTLDNNEGVWIWEKEDEEATLTVSFDTPQRIDNIVLYDNDSLSDNITAGHLSFSDGTVLQTPALLVNGAGTVIQTGGLSGIEWFSFTVDASEGERAGLTEIEAYREDSGAPELSFLKITNEQGDFIYDTLYEKGDSLNFKVYQYPVKKGTYDLLVDGKEMLTGVTEDRLSIENDFRRHTVQIRSHEEPSFSDTVLMRPKTLQYKVMVPLIQRIEQERDKTEEE